MDVILRHASQAEAEDGSNDNIVASPKAVKQAIAKQVIARMHQPDGFGTLDANTLQPETEVPLRLRETALDGRYLTRTDATARDTTVDAGLASKAPLASPALTGTPTAPTAAAATNTTQIATTAFVQAWVVSLTADIAAKAPLASPALTGAPTAPTATAGDNSTRIATTAFVQAALGSGAYAPLASPAFTGNPTAPTPLTGDNDTSIATTAFVKAQGYITAGALSSYAPLDSPTLTGAPNATTPTTANDSTRIATTAWVKDQGYTVSDARLKTGIGPSRYAYGPLIDRLAFKDFTFKADPLRWHTGLIAQEAYRVWPELVVPGTDDLPSDHPDYRPWRLNPKEAILPLLQEVQALRARVAALEAAAAKDTP